MLTHTELRDVQPSMVIVSDFTLEFNKENDLFYVRSKEKIICPICGGELNVAGSRKRRYIRTAGTVCVLVIRRLKCKCCGKIHHELPDILVPYKRHCAETIECIVEEEVISVCCEVSTIKKIADWFGEKAQYFYGCIESIFADRESKRDIFSVSLLQRIKNIIGDRSSWLKRLVRSVVNSNLWVHTRSEYLPD